MVIQKIIKEVSESDFLMALFFMLEIWFFGLAGYLCCVLTLVPAIEFIFALFLSFFIGLFNAFLVGEAIKFKERRKILNG